MTTAQRHEKISINEIQRRMRDAGSHWWDRDSMRFFGTRVASSVYSGPGGVFFVTRDGRNFDWRETGNTGYSVREYRVDANDIKTRGDVGLHDFSSDAAAECARLAFGDDPTAKLGLSQEQHREVSVLDDLVLALQRAGLQATHGEAMQLVAYAGRHHKACERECNEGGDHTTPLENAIVRWLAKTLPGVTAKFSGDPRGCTFKLVLPNGATNDFANEGWVVPTEVE